MVESALPILFFLIGAALCAVVFGFILRARMGLIARHLETKAVDLANAQAELQTSKLQVAALEERGRLAELLRADVVVRDTKIESLQSEIVDLREERSHLQTRLEEEHKALEEQKAILSEAQKQLADAFNALSSDALRKNNQAFLELATQTLERFNKEASGDLEKKQQAIDSVVNPLKESLQKVDIQIKEMEEKRSAAYATLSEQVKGLSDTQTKLQSETSNLVKALRNPNQRGRWGEMQLKRVVEMAGMLAWCDFHEQQTTSSDGNVLRPDLTVKLPNHKIIVVDSKTPLEGYLRAIESQTEEEKADGFKAHARQVREHIRQLSSKRYWDQFESTPEIVVMFIPGEPVFGAALDNDPSLIEYGVENKVLIATPVTLIGLLRSVAYGWRHEQLEENAQQISQLGKDLYARVSAVAEHFAKLGKNLDRAVGSYNDAVGSLETRVLPQARKFKELGAATADDIEQLEPLERTARALHRPELKQRAIVAQTVDLFAEAVN